MAETERINISTQTGDYVGINYSDGQKHLYSVHPDTEKLTDLKKAEFLAERGYKPYTPAEREQAKAEKAEREEQARKAGDVALDAVTDDPEGLKKPELQLGPAVWHSVKAGLGGNNDLKVNVLGPSQKYPDGINPRSGVLYVELVAEDGTRYTNVRADRLEFADTPEAEGAAGARKTGKAMDAEADEVVARLDEVLPPSDREKREKARGEKKEKTIEERFDNLKLEMDQKFNELKRSLEQLGAPASGGAEAKPADSADRQAKPEASGQKDRELGNKIGDPGKVEIRGQDRDGRPFIYRINDKGEWEVSRNGDLAKEWFPATHQGMVRDLGEIPMFAVPDGEDKPGGEGVDAEIMEASLARIAEIQKEMSENPTPERLAELIKELGEEQAKMQESWDSAPAEEVSETAETAISEAEAVDNSKKRGRGIFQKAKDALNRLRGRVYGAHSQANTAINGRGESGTVIVADADTSAGDVPPEGRKQVTVFDEEGKPVSETHEVHEKDEKDRRRRLGMVAGGLLVGGAVVAAFLLGSKYGGHDVINNFCDGKPSGIGPDHMPNGGGNLGLQAEHVDFFNNAPGHRITALESVGLHPGQDSAGRQIIADLQGNTVVGADQLPNGIAKENGVLSEAAVKALRAKGFEVGYEQLQNVGDNKGNLYMSVVR